ncbi:SpoIIE family protein phosphatase [Nocardia jejuensis]|uniref:SpoIIE family protein phosphatase n=1 Tax=Nocardia jejuensis TaxID=328049 RepID=UPI00082F54B0|nr:SpoIIE family protein phosphatase [Nocardia jejuensis]
MEQPSWSTLLHGWWSSLHEADDPIPALLCGLRDRPDVEAAFSLDGPGSSGRAWADADGIHLFTDELATELNSEIARHTAHAAAAGTTAGLAPDREQIPARRRDRPDDGVGSSGPSPERSDPGPGSFQVGAAGLGPLVATGRARAGAHVVSASYRRDGGGRAVIGVITAGPSAARVVGAVGQVRDIAAATDRRRAERSALGWRQVQDAILAEASLRMSSSLDIDDTLRAIVRMVVPAIADGAAVHVERDGRLKPVAVAHVDARRERRLAEYLREGRWAGSVSVHGLDSTGEDSARPRPADLPADANLDTMATMVLRAHGREVGLLSVFQRHGSPRRVTAEFLHNLAGRAALAVDNAALHERQRRDVLQLQQHLLPGILPTVEGIEIASSYRVAENTLDVGGDFYGAVVAPDARLHAVIGDVCGRGAAAAALTGLARHTVETLLTAGHSVERALHALNAKMLHEKITRFLTLAVASLSVEPGGQDCRAEIFAAGHPRPLVIRREGQVEEPACSGLLVGHLPELSLEPATVRLRPGDTVLLYTDGLTEARDDDGLFFEPELPATLTRLRELPPAQLARTLTAGAGRFRVHDDAAVLVLRHLGPVVHDATVELENVVETALDAVGRLRGDAENTTLPVDFTERLRAWQADGITTAHLRVCGDAAWTRLDITPAGPERATNGGSAWAEMTS